QLVEDVEAVDAAEGPEVEEDDLAAQVLEAQVIAAGVDPPSAREFRSAQADAIARGSRGRRCCRGGCAGGRRGREVLLSGHGPDPPICRRPAVGRASYAVRTSHMRRVTRVDG